MKKIPDARLRDLARMTNPRAVVGGTPAATMVEIGAMAEEILAHRHAAAPSPPSLGEERKPFPLYGFPMRIARGRIGTEPLDHIYVNGERRALPTDVAAGDAIEAPLGAAYDLEQA